jgi:hypothetical protein
MTTPEVKPRTTRPVSHRYSLPQLLERLAAAHAELQP